VDVYPKKIVFDKFVQDLEKIKNLIKISIYLNIDLNEIDENVGFFYEF
jgi:hypothetical protein